MKTQTYYSTTTAPPKKSLRNHQGLLVQTLVGAGVAVLAIAASAVLPLLVVITIAGAGMVFAIAKGLQLNQAMLPDPMGTAARVADSPLPVDELRSNTATQQVVVEEQLRSVAEAPNSSDNEEVLYRGRYHPMALIKSLLKRLPLSVVVWFLATLLPILAGAEDRRTVMVWLWLLVAAGVAGIVGSFMKVQFLGKPRGLRWLRWPATFILVVVLPYIAAMAWAGALVGVTALLYFIGAFLLVQAWARWKYSYIIATPKRVAIELESPWFYLLRDTKPTVPIKKLTSVKPGKSRLEKMLNLNCGSINADTPGDQDREFNNMRHIVDHMALYEILFSMIA